MAIAETDPRNRNLTVASLSVITFHIGDGRIDETIKLPMLNVTYHDTTALSITLLAILFWFLLAYWQHQNANEKERRSRKIDDFHYTNLYVKGWILKYYRKYYDENAHIVKATKAYRPQVTYVIRGYNESNNSSLILKLNNSTERLITYYLEVKSAFYRPAILKEKLPYILFIFAYWILIENILQLWVNQH